MDGWRVISAELATRRNFVAVFGRGNVADIFSGASLERFATGRRSGERTWLARQSRADAFNSDSGTLSGVGKFLKEKNPAVKIFAVEPATSPVLSQGKAGAHKIQGIGAGFVPETLDTKIYDEVLPIENEDAFKYGREFPRAEGVLVGISSGAALAAAVQLANRAEFKNKNIVVLLPDTGDRYLSTDLFKDA